MRCLSPIPQMNLGGGETLNTHLVGTLILTGNKEIAIRSDEVYQSGDISEVERKMPSLV